MAAGMLVTALPECLSCMGGMNCLQRSRQASVLLESPESAEFVLPAGAGQCLPLCSAFKRQRLHSTPCLPVEQVWYTLAWLLSAAAGERRWPSNAQAQLHAQVQPSSAHSSRPQRLLLPGASAPQSTTDAAWISITGLTPRRRIYVARVVSWSSNGERIITPTLQAEQCTHS